MTERKICLVFAAGEYYQLDQPLPTPWKAMLHGSQPLCVAADGGADHTRSAGIHPDVVIGDFDSIQEGLPSDSRVVRLSPDKDDTDMMAALKIGWSQGCREFHIYGALGGRIDHTISNIQILAKLARQGGIGYAYGNGSILCAISNAELFFNGDQTKVGGIVSVLSHADSSYDIDEEGLKFELDHATMTNDMVQGVSNEFLPGTPARIAVGAGVITVTYPIAAGLPQWQPHIHVDGDLGPIDTGASQALAHPHTR